MEATHVSEATERRGRRWVFGTFLLCPCHLPLTLAAAASLLGGTALGTALRDHQALAVAIVVIGWAAGTANGFRLLWHAKRNTCPLPLRSRLRAGR